MDVMNNINTASNNVDILKVAYSYLKREYNVDITDYDKVLDALCYKLKPFIDMGIVHMSKDIYHDNMSFSVGSPAMFTILRYINNGETCGLLHLDLHYNVPVEITEDGEIVDTNDMFRTSRNMTIYTSIDNVSRLELSLLYKMIRLAPDFIIGYKKNISDYFSIEITKSNNIVGANFILDSKIITKISDTLNNNYDDMSCDQMYDILKSLKLNNSKHSYHSNLYQKYVNTDNIEEKSKRRMDILSSLKYNLSDI